MQKILLFSQKGGTGKTTLCFNLANAFYNRGQKVSIIDTDPQGSMQTFFRMSEDKKINVYEPDGHLTLEHVKRLDDDIVFFDSSSNLSDINKDLLLWSDVVVIPVLPDLLNIWATENTIKFIRKTKTNAKILIVVNGMPYNLSLEDRKNREAKELLEEAFNDKNIFFSEIFVQWSDDFVLKLDKTVFESRDREAIKEINLLANEIIELMKG